MGRKKCSSIKKVLRLFPKQIKTKLWNNGITASKFYFLYKYSFFNVKELWCTMNCWSPQSVLTTVHVVIAHYLTSSLHHLSEIELHLQILPLQTFPKSEWNLSLRKQNLDKDKCFSRMLGQYSSWHGVVKMVCTVQLGINKQNTSDLSLKKVSHSRNSEFTQNSQLRILANSLVYFKKKSFSSCPNGKEHL